MSENSSMRSSMRSSSTRSSHSSGSLRTNYSDESTKRPCKKCNRKRRDAEAFYPGVSRGHENCLGHRVVVTPKNMGWLWSKRDSLGITINRNWIPGAVPKNVASVMEKAWNGVKYPEDVLYPKWRGVARPQKKVERDGSMASGADEVENGDGQPEEELAVEEEELPVLTVTKHEGEYLIQMNPIRDENGKIPPIEPVRFRLQTKRDLGYSTSQSSLEFELLRQR